MMSRRHPIGGEMDNGLTAGFGLNGLGFRQSSELAVIRGGRGRTGLACSNRRRVSAEHDSRIHLISGNGSPSTLQIAMGDNLANSASH